MQYPFLLLISLLLGPSAAPPAPVVRFSRISAATYEQGRRQMRPVGTPVTFPLRARGGQLTIPTNAGPQVYRNVVVDEAAIKRGMSEDESTSYAYKGFLTRFQRHLVEVTFYETMEWWLIGKDGRRLTLYGEPHYSPDQQSIVTMCPGLEYSGGQPNAVQLFRLQNGALRKLWELRPSDWEPEEAFWMDANTVYLKREEWRGGQQHPLSYWKLTVAPTI